MNTFRLFFIIIILIFQTFSLETQDKFVTQPALQIQWTSTEFQAADVGIGSEGDTYIAGLDGKLYLYSLLQNTYTLIEGDREIPNIDRLDVDAEGTPYVVSRCGGQIFYLNCENTWVQLPGCANDIGVGRGGEIWKVGCDARLGGYGVWKLYCKCDCKCSCNRNCTRFRHPKYVPINRETKNCNWHRIEGGAMRIDVDTNGNPWTVADNHMIFKYNGDNWSLVPGYFAEDITISNEGVTFVAGFESNVARLICDELGTWQKLSGTAKSITAGPFSLPFMVDIDDHVQTTAIKSINTLS